MFLCTKKSWNFGLLLTGLLFVLGACSHAPPEIVQVFNQVNQVYDPADGAWSPRLSVFVQASSTDGTKVFDRLHLIHDQQELVFSLGANQWIAVEKPGEFWVGTNGLSFPDGKIPSGAWRALLVTKAGQRVEALFQVPPLAPDATSARTTKVVAVRVPGAPGRVRVSGWVEDSVAWFRDAKGLVIAQTPVVGTEFVVPPGTVSFLLYSYDNNRGEGLEAGPFPVQELGKPADS